MHRFSFSGMLIALTLLIACSSAPVEGQAQSHPKASAEELAKLDKAYFASGCFWCVEAIFESVEGVEESVSGYAGGEEKDPSYRQVSAGRTGHAEAVEVYYDSEVVSFETLVKVFFGSHDPTTLNRQGPDRGPQYRSIAFYQNEAEKEAIEAHIVELVANGTYSEGEIVTEVSPLAIFYDAEDYHQDYERNNPNQPYVKAVSIPRLRRFQKNFPELLKADH